MVACDVRPRLRCQHGVGFTDFVVRAPQARDAKPWLVLLGEEPLLLACPFAAFSIGVVGELEEAIGDNKAAPTRELAPFRPEVEDRLAPKPRPTPSALHEFGCTGLTHAWADNRSGLTNLN